MTNKLSPSILLASSLSIALSIGCSARMTEDPGDDTGSQDMSSGQCKAQDSQCVGSAYQTCQGGVFKTKTTCAAPQVCAKGLGCADCTPGVPTCVGDESRACGAAGTPGDLIETCSPGQCMAGKCLETCKSGDLVYVVDETYNLLGFNPKDNTFKSIGKLSCPAGPNLPGWGGLGNATPFSMSVDREGKAWVLYTSGEIFHVSTKDAACTKTMFKPAQSGLELFGMGFVSDSKGSTSETLYVVGGAADSIEDGDLAKIDPKTQVLTPVGNVVRNEVGPELTGTGNAEFYGYFPGTMKTVVAQIDKANGQNIKTWNLPALPGTARAWAFAHWGGRFYIFITTQDLLGNNNSQVQLFDPKDGKVTTVLNKIPYVIVGAGVSTCAPVVIG